MEEGRHKRGSLSLPLSLSPIECAGRAQEREVPRREAEKEIHDNESEQGGLIKSDPHESQGAAGQTPLAPMGGGGHEEAEDDDLGAAAAVPGTAAVGAAVSGVLPRPDVRPAGQAQDVRRLPQRATQR